MYILFIIFPLFWVCVNSSIFDQRQTGDLNVQVDLKDVRIFALMKGDKEEYVDYDYTYDYSELTIKPQNRTTPKPFNGTSVSTAQPSTISESTTLGPTLQDNTITSEDFITTTISSSNNDSRTTIKYTTESTSHVNSQKNVTVKPTSNTTVKNCKRGFVLNQKGNCQLKLNSTGNAVTAVAMFEFIIIKEYVKINRCLKTQVPIECQMHLMDTDSRYIGMDIYFQNRLMKLVKLSQKLKLRRENKSHDNP